VPAEKETQPVKNDRPDIFKVCDHVFERYASVGYDKLAPAEKVFICVWSLEGEVNNGGFDQYYFNSSGDHALDVEESLKAIGAKHTAQLVEQANTLFGATGPSSDRAARQSQLNSLEDAKTKRMNEIEKEFMKYKDNLEELLKAYVSKNAEVLRPK
jgi:Domain of unknown function (DUF4375)